jgi:DNA polymerase
MPPATSRAKAPAPNSPDFVEPVVFSDSASKLAAFEQLRERALVCQKCSNLVSSRKNVVFGVGSIDAELMFIGEAPGAEEDEQGEPFVGRAGQLLTKIIQTMGLSREQVYIANILKCRPDTPGQDYGNRPPTPEEMERCLPYLHAQIDLIKPKVIIALGATAVDGLFGKVPGVGITKLRGKWREYRGTPVMPTYHPSYLLRPNPNNIKRETWEDMLQVMERLKMPASEKQRGYFLKVGA